MRWNRTTEDYSTTTARGTYRITVNEYGAHLSIDGWQIGGTYSTVQSAKGAAARYDAKDAAEDEAQAQASAEAEAQTVAEPTVKAGQTVRLRDGRCAVVAYHDGKTARVLVDGTREYWALSDLYAVGSGPLSREPVAEASAEPEALTTPLDAEALPSRAVAGWQVTAEGLKAYAYPLGAEDSAPYELRLTLEAGSPYVGQRHYMTLQNCQRAAEDLARAERGMGGELLTEPVTLYLSTPEDVLDLGTVTTRTQASQRLASLASPEFYSAECVGLIRRASRAVLTRDIPAEYVTTLAEDGETWGGDEAPAPTHAVLAVPYSAQSEATPDDI